MTQHEVTAMNTKLIDDIIARETSGVKIAEKFSVAPSYVSKVSRDIGRMQGGVSTDEQGKAVCSSCKNRVLDLSFQVEKDTGQVLGLACDKCKRKASHLLPVVGDKIDDPRVMTALRFLNEFFKTNAEYLFANPAVVKYIEDNGEKFTEVENLCQA